MIKEVEDIIKNKAYFELTNDERKQVGDLAHNEEEYNNMQWFLTGTAASFGADKIKASSKLKKGVMTHLTESKKKRGFWLNSVGLFTLEKGEKIYKKPAFQLGIAAVAVLGFLFFYSNGIENVELALNDTANNEDINNKPNNKITPATYTQNEASPNIVEDISIEQDDLKIENRERKVEELELKDVETIGYNEGLIAPPPPVIELVESVDDNVEIADFIMDQDMDMIEEITENESTLFKDEKVELSKEHEDEKRDKETGFGGTLTKKKNKSNYSEEPVVLDNITRSGAGEELSRERLFITEEKIAPKALHIDKTKELNVLFFIEK